MSAGQSDGGALTFYSAGLDADLPLETAEQRRGREAREALSRLGEKVNEFAQAILDVFGRMAQAWLDAFAQLAPVLQPLIEYQREVERATKRGWTNPQARVAMLGMKRDRLRRWKKRQIGSRDG